MQLFQKSFRFYTEKYRLTFRADAFNLNQQVLFPEPDNNPADGHPLSKRTVAIPNLALLRSSTKFPRILRLRLSWPFKHSAAEAL